MKTNLLDIIAKRFHDLVVVHAVRLSLSLSISHIHKHTRISPLHTKIFAFRPSENRFVNVEDERRFSYHERLNSVFIFPSAPPTDITHNLSTHTLLPLTFFPSLYSLIRPSIHPFVRSLCNVCALCSKIRTCHRMVLLISLWLNATLFQRLPKARDANTVNK